MTQPVKRLKKTQTIPFLGFGTAGLQEKECVDKMLYALDIGYRHFDTAEIYLNQREIGYAIKESKIPREEIFITSKVWRNNLTEKGVYDACKRSLDYLETEYIDLYLIHWPNPDIPLIETLRAFRTLQENGFIKSIGVSNFPIYLLEEAIELQKNWKDEDKIVMNQIEFHPTLNQKEVLDYCTRNNISVTAYSPLGQGDDLDIPEIKKIAEKHDAKPSQIIINWLISKDIVVIPNSSDRYHILENFGALEIKLSSDDIRSIDNISGNNRKVKPSFALF